MSETEIESRLNSYEYYTSLHFEEAEWDRIFQGMFSFLCMMKKDVKSALGFDPKQSALFGSYPELLERACDPEVPIVYIPKFREFGVMVIDGGPSQLTLEFDPWSGKALPSSVRDEWFETLERLGMDSDDQDSLPAEYRSEAWWIGQGL